MGRVRIKARVSTKQPRISAMINAKTCAVALIIPWIAMLTGCASPHISIGSWKDSSYNKKVTKVFVIGVTQRTDIRHAFETSVVEKLQQNGVTAVASSGLVPLDKDMGKEAVKARVKAVIQGKGFDAVLVSRLVGVDKTTTYVPPSSHMEYSFTRDVMTAYSVAFTPGYLIHDTVVSIETNLYDTGSEELVWSMTSKSFNPADATEVIKPLSESIIQDLKQNGLI